MTSTNARNPRGSVTVCKRNRVLRLRLPRSAFGGEQKYLSLGIPDTSENRRVAEIKASEIQQDLIFDRFDPTLDKYRIYAASAPNRQSLPLEELFQLYFDFKSKHLEPSSLKNFKTASTHLQHCPHQRIDQASKIYNWFLDNLSQEAARRNLMLISAACDWAVIRGLAKTNPFLALPKIKRVRHTEIDPFSEKERELVIKGFESHSQFNFYAPFVKFLFFTGCRTSEAVGLLWEDISLDQSKITFSGAFVEGHRKSTKTRKVRSFPINPKLKEALPNRLDSDLLVFPAPRGKPINSQKFGQRPWRKILSGLNIRYRKLYSTRHTFVTSCLNSGIPVNQVAHWVGNSPKVILEHYAGLIDVDVPEF